MDDLPEKRNGALVLYTTRHGATQRYAERIGEALHAAVMPAAGASTEEANARRAIVLGCPVYMGMIKGLDFFAAHAAELADRRLVLFTCGLMDPAEENVRRKLCEQIEKRLGEAAKRVEVFHLRGGLHWQGLGPMERLIMKMLVSQAKRKPEDARSETDRLMIENEGGAFDFLDEADLSPIVRAALGEEEKEA